MIARVNEKLGMKEIAAVLDTASGPKAERLAAQKVFLQRRGEIWNDIQEGRFSVAYVSADHKKFVELREGLLSDATSC